MLLLTNTTLKQRILIAVFFYVIWVGGVFYFSFQQEKRSIYNTLDQQLESAALTAALLLPDNLHHRDMVKQDQSTHADRRNRLTLSNYTDNVDITYIYTLILRDNKIIFTSSSATKEERESGVGFTDYFDHYDDVDPRIFELFKLRKKGFLEYTDQWGSFRSIFIPRYSKDGTFYFAVADHSIDYIQSLLNQHLYQNLAISILFLLFAYPIFLVSTQYIKKKSSALKKQLKQKSAELTVNQQRLERAMNSSKQAWFEINVQTGNITVSEEYLTLLGIGDNLTQTVSTVKMWAANIHPDDRDVTMQTFQSGIKSGEAIIMVFRRKNIDGGWAWIHATGQIVEWDNNGKPLLMAGMNMDISERKRNELVLQALAESSFSADSDIFKTIVRQLATSLNIRYGFIAVTNKELSEATTLAFWSNDQIVENMSYKLKGSPCFDSPLATGTTFYSQNIQKLFPNSELLLGMEAESYLGISLKDKNNKPVGTLAIINDKPLPEEESRKIIALLQSLAVRVMIELDQKEKEEDLKLLAQIFHDTHESIILVDNDGIIVDANPACCTLGGYSRDELIGHPVQTFRSDKLSPDFYQSIGDAVISTGFWRGETWHKTKDNKDIAISLTISQLYDENGNPTHRINLGTNITENKKQQAELELIAHYDVLTKLPNRALFADRFNQAAEYAHQTESMLAVCFLDLDNFKPINDNYGHDIGDRLLIDVAKRLTECIREGDTASRQGGDEFTLLLRNIDSFSQCEHLLDNICTHLASPYLIDGHYHNISVSVGTTVYPLDNSDLDLLLRHADQTMYQAKLLGKNQHQFFSAIDNNKISYQLRKIQEITRAFENEEFCLYYQPKVNMKTGKVFGAEALIRWIHPDKGLILPLDFLPLIEGHDLEILIGNWVINEALTQLELWQSQNISLEVSVNISSHHIQSTNFFEKLDSMLALHPAVNSQDLQLEILESSALGDIEVISNIITSCQDLLGVNVALDDFGTSYSSLSHMRSLSANTIKIDRSFVHNLLLDPGDYSIIEGIIGLANAFNSNIIAEGVETEDHGLMLVFMGCYEAQGCGISNPLPAHEIPIWLTNYTPNSSWMTSGNEVHSPQQAKIMILQLTTKSWFQNINDLLLNTDKSSFNEYISKCHLGAWIERLKSEETFSSTQLDRLQKEHDAMFSLAEELFSLHHAGDLDTVHKRLNEFKESYLKTSSMIQQYS